MNLRNTQVLINKILLNIQNDNRIHYLKQKGVIEWILGDKTWIQQTISTKIHEDIWGKDLIKSNTSQWTTKLGESILYELLVLHNNNPKKINKGIKGANNKEIRPDFEADDGIYENKARTYNTTGTAGEKILGTPMKYCECKRLYNKPLYIVCMGYQEQEATDSFQIFEPKSLELVKILEFYEKELNIRFIKASDMLKEYANL